MRDRQTMEKLPSSASGAAWWSARGVDVDAHGQRRGYGAVRRVRLSRPCLRRARPRHAARAVRPASRTGQCHGARARCPRPGCGTGSPGGRRRPGRRCRWRRPWICPSRLCPTSCRPSLAVVRGASTRLLLADARRPGEDDRGRVPDPARAGRARGGRSRARPHAPHTARSVARRNSDRAAVSRPTSSIASRSRARDRQAPSGLSPFQAPGHRPDLDRPGQAARHPRTPGRALLGRAGDRRSARRERRLGPCGRRRGAWAHAPGSSCCSRRPRTPATPTAFAPTVRDWPASTASRRRSWFRHRPARNSRQRAAEAPRRRRQLDRPRSARARRAGPIRAATGPGRRPRVASGRAGPSQARAVQPGGAGIEPAAPDGLARATRRAGRSALPALRRRGEPSPDDAEQPAVLREAWAG